MFGVNGGKKMNKFEESERDLKLRPVGVEADFFIWLCDVYAHSVVINIFHRFSVLISKPKSTIEQSICNNFVKFAFR